MSLFQGKLRGTTIGSLPFLDAREATELVFTYAPLLPSWVQLPKNPGEGMLEQYNEGLPGIREIEGRVYFDTEDVSFEQDLLQSLELFRVDRAPVVEVQGHEDIILFHRTQLPQDQVLAILGSR